MTAIKDQSMLRDEHLDEDERVLKRLGIKYLDFAHPPVGHVYSVMVEELGIEKPDFQKFIDRLNKYIEVGGDGFARIKSKNEYLSPRAARKFCTYLQYEWPSISEEVFCKIVKEAYGGYLY